MSALDGLVFHNSFHTFLGHILDFGLIAVLWDILSHMFHLLVVDVGLLHRTVLSLHDSLVLCDGLSDGDILNHLLRNIFHHLTLIRNLLLDGHRLIVDIRSLNWDLFYVRLRLGRLLRVDQLLFLEVALGKRLVVHLM